MRVSHALFGIVIAACASCGARGTPAEQAAWPPGQQYYWAPPGPPAPPRAQPAAETPAAVQSASPAPPNVPSPPSPPASADAVPSQPVPMSAGRWWTASVYIDGEEYGYAENLDRTIKLPTAIERTGWECERTPEAHSATHASISILCTRSADRRKLSLSASCRHQGPDVDRAEGVLPGKSGAPHIRFVVGCRNAAGGP